MLVPLKLPPGFSQNGTPYQAKDRWAEGSLVRFFEKTIRPVGGWQEFTASADVAVDYTDTFTDTNGTTLGAHVSGGVTWTKTNGSGSITIQTNELQNPASSTAHLYVWNQPADVDVVDATINFNASNTTNSRRMGIVLRGNIANAACYFVVVGNSNQSSLTILRSDAAGSFTSLALDLAAVANDTNPHILRATIVGSTINAYIDGVLKLTATDATIASGLPGVGMSGSVTGVGRIQDLTVTTADLTEITLAGVPRAIIGWRGSDGNQTVAMGTNTKLYAHLEGSLHDITPSGFTTGSVDAEYDTGGYGDGVFGFGPFGVSDPAQTAFAPPAVFHLDTFGEYLVACSSPNDGKLYVWDRGVSSIAVEMSGAPTQNLGIVVTPERFVVALGAGGISRRVKWASQETTDTWTPDVSNTAGSLDVQSEGILVAGRRGKGETILWTTDDVHAMRYIGGTLVYAIERVGGKCGLPSPGAVTMVDDKAIWMGKGQFFLYDGYVQAIPCDVSDRVFSDINQNQIGKVVSLSISRFGEIWWFYPSANSTENDRYVVWNYRENHWTTGALVRTAGCDSGALEYPLLAASNGKLFEHERTFVHTDLDDSTLTPYLESGPVEAGEGDQVLYISQILPDERTLGQVELSLYGSFEPMANETLYGPFSINKNTDARMSARWVRLRLDQVVEEDWRVGVIRLNGKTAGSRGSPR